MLSNIQRWESIKKKTQESKKTRKHAFDKESEQEKKKKTITVKKKKKERFNKMRRKKKKGKWKTQINIKHLASVF